MVVVMVLLELVGEGNVDLATCEILRRGFSKSRRIYMIMFALGTVGETPSKASGDIGGMKVWRIVGLRVIVSRLWSPEQRRSLMLHVLFVTLTDRFIWSAVWLAVGL